MALVEEEHALRDIAAPGNGAQRGRTVEASVDPGAAVPAERAGPDALVRLTVAPDQRPAQRLSSSSRRAAAAKACMLAKRSLRPVATRIALCVCPATAIQAWPAGSP